MGDGKIRRYKKDLPYSYAFGVYPTIELLKRRPEHCTRVLLRSNADRNTGVPKIDDLCARRGVRSEVADKALARIGAPENCYAVGVFTKYEEVLDPDAAHLVLVGPRDMGNLGSTLRTMLAFGVTNLAIIRPAAQMFDPKAVRASMGSVFHATCQYFDSFKEYRKQFDRSCYPFMVDGETLLSETSFDSPASLVFGSESSGLDDSFRAVGHTVRIPQAGTVDSLNVAASVAIALYEFTGG